jgi:hypothetical protein
MLRHFIITLLSLAILLVHPVLALERLNASDFKEPDVVIMVNDLEYKPTLSEGKFVVAEVFEEGEAIEVNYVIEPKDEDAAKEVGGESGRSITIRTEIKNAVIDAMIRYGSGAGVGSSSTPGKDFLNIKIAEYDPTAETSLDRIEVDVQGELPLASSRLEEIKALRFDVQEAEEDCLPPVLILIIDHSRFRNDISSVKEQRENLTAILNSYLGKVDTSKLNDYLNLASKNITLADSYYGDGEYRKADEKLSNAYEWLEFADSEAKKVKAEYTYNQADKRLEEIGNILDNIEVYLEEIEGKELVNTSTLLNYKTEFKGVQESIGNLAEELAVAKAYIDSEKYSEAESKSNEIIGEVEGIESSANTLFDELKDVVIPEETVTAESTLEATPTSFELPTIDLKLIGIVIGGTIAIAAVFGIRKYMRRRKWDELK